MRADMESLAHLVSTAHFAALATNNSLCCLLNASRPTYRIQTLQLIRAPSGRELSAKLTEGERSSSNN